MKVGIVLAAEPLAIDSDVGRSFRGGMLAEALAKRDHEVTWWTSNFNHVTKRHRFPGNHSLDTSAGYEIRFLHSSGYRRNVSLSRVRHNRCVARAFKRDVGAGKLNPDLLFVCLPTLELAEVAVDVATTLGAPAVIDIRDPWPDIYLTVVPQAFRPIARALLAPEFLRAARTIAKATAITAVSQTYLDWAVALGGRSPSSLDRVFPIGCPDPAPLCDRRLETDGPFVAVFAGTFVKSSDLRTVVLAARELALRGRGDIQIVLAGDGNNREKLEAMATGLKNVAFAGWLGQAELRSLFTRSSVGLVAYSDGAVQSLPNKPFEYWAAGLPIISSLRGELEGIMRRENVGLSYRAGQPTSLADALCSLADDRSTCRGMASRARQLYRDNFAAARIYSDLAQYLERLVQDA